MAKQFKELWRNTVQNSEIAISGSAIFGTEVSDFQNRNKHGSMNFTTITNRSSNAIRVTLDALIFAEIPSNSVLVIEASDGVYFDLIKITNLSGVSVCSAQSITLRYGRSEQIES